MKTMLYVIVALLFLALFSPAEEPLINAGIQKTVDQFVINWNKHDPGAMTDSWITDGDLINPVGRRARGREQIAQLFTDEQTGSGLFRNSTMSMEVNTVREICTGYAIVDIEATVIGAEMGPSAPPENKYHVVAVMEEKEGNWKLVAVRPYVFTSGPPPK